MKIKLVNNFKRYSKSIKQPRCFKKKSKFVSMEQENYSPVFSNVQIISAKNISLKFSFNIHGYRLGIF